MIAQIGRFAGVGVAATLTHVFFALMAEAMFGLSPQGANLVGFAAAFALSYAGHATLTFSTPAGHATHLPRFFLLSAAGLATSSAITFIVCTLLGGTLATAMLLVAAVVPGLTFVGARFWAFADARDAARPEWSGILLSVAAGAAAFALMLDRSINHDTGWYLIAARKWLAGATLYVDIIEVNPPLNFYLTVPVIWLADGLGMTDSNAQYLFVSGLTTISLLWVWKLLCGAGGLSPARRLFLLAGTAAALIVPSLVDFAQREHLMLLMLVPYLYGYLLRVPDRIENGALQRATFASLGLCLKPYFMLYPIALTLSEIVRSRSLKPIFVPSNLIIVAAGAAYSLYVFLVHPEYLFEIVPLATQVYGAYGLPDSLVIRGFALPLLGILVAVTVIAFKDRVPSSGIIAAAVLAAVGSFAIQWTGYSYQALPILSLVAIAFVWHVAQPTARRLSRVIAIGGLYTSLLTCMDHGLFRSGPSESFTAELSAAVGPKPAVTAFTTSLWPSFPLVHSIGGVWTSRYPAHWLLPGALNGLNATDCSVEPEMCARFKQIVSETREAILTDFENGRPDILIFDKDPNYFEVSPFRYEEFLATDDRYARLMSEFTPFREGPRFTIWVRASTLEAAHR